MLAAQVQWTWTVHTEVFDGPLDLLLYLVKRDGIDLRTVKIARVTDSYLEYLEKLDELNIAVASDYLVMAATLCHLKSLELLPRLPSIMAEEEVDPREALARRLETYERFKAAAEALAARPILGRDVFVRKPLDIGEVDRPLVPGVDAFGLLDLYYQMLTRPEKVEPTHTVFKSEIDLSDCCRRVLVSLGGQRGRRNLTDVLYVFPERSERIVAFLSILEMTRLQWLSLEQEGHLGAVHVTANVPMDQDLSAIRGEVVVEATA